MIMLDSELSVRFLGIYDSREFIEVVRIKTNHHKSAVSCAKWAHKYMATESDLKVCGNAVFMIMPRVNDFCLCVQPVGLHGLCLIECTREERNNFLRDHQAGLVILTKPIRAV